MFAHQLIGVCGHRSDKYWQYIVSLRSRKHVYNPWCMYLISLISCAIAKSGVIICIMEIIFKTLNIVNLGYRSFPPHVNINKNNNNININCIYCPESRHKTETINE